jgi:D-alanyl-D-alanine endopeptidase (penicillin-binding protein 7)
MSQKVIDFLSSIGMMVLGIGLLFFSSVTFTARPVHTLVATFPTSQVRPLVHGGDEVPVSLPVSRPSVPLQINTSTFSAPLTAISAMVVDDKSNAVLFKKNPSNVRSLASITKLMTALVLSDLSMNWVSTTVISSEDFDASSHNILVGEQYRLEDLWYTALVGSSNTAIDALVRASGLTVEQFVIRMNEKAQALGLNSLRFVEPTGLDGRNLGTAMDILKLLKEALKVDRIATALQTKEFYASPINAKIKHRVWTTDWLLSDWVNNDFDKDVLVGKTGYIEESGYNFVVRILGKQSHVIRVVVLGAVSNEARFSEARDLAVWTFENYRWPDDVGYGHGGITE